MLVSFIVVNYNSGELLEKCVTSVINAMEDTNYEIIIWDNMSVDHSMDFIGELNMPDTIKLIRSKDNLGFAKGNNGAAAYATGMFLHFLNPDALIDGHLLEDIKSLQQAGCADEKYLYVNVIDDEDKSIGYNRHLIPTWSNFIRRTLGGNAQYWYLGASVIAPRKFFQEIGGWPEDYFMYAEDMDLFYVAFRKGGSVRELGSVVKHIGKGTTRNVWSEFDRLVRIESSTRKFYKKYGKLWEYYSIVPMFFLYKAFTNRKPVQYIKTVYKANIKALNE